MVVIEVFLTIQLLHAIFVLNKPVMSLFVKSACFNIILALQIGFYLRKRYTPVIVLFYLTFAVQCAMIILDSYGFIPRD